MKYRWSVRMRASKFTPKTHRATGGQREVHISGAEGLYPSSNIPSVVSQYVERALHHPKGKPDKIVVTVEFMHQIPRILSAPTITTVDARTSDEAKVIVQDILLSLGISRKAIHKGWSVIKKGAMRGAAIISIEKGTRLEPDRQRGVRVSRLGITPAASKRFSALLTPHGINTDTVKEALVIASKVIFHKDVVAELCVSDDPDYTTGYVASDRYGYVRIPHIKPKKNGAGGRVFYVSETADIADIINYLELSPVEVGKAAHCRGALSLNEILHNYHR